MTVIGGTWPNRVVWLPWTSWQICQDIPILPFPLPSQRQLDANSRKDVLLDLFDVLPLYTIMRHVLTG